MVNKKGLLGFSYILFAFLTIALIIFLQFKSGGYYWPYAHIGKGVLGGVVVAIIYSKIKKKELTIKSLMRWSFPFGVLGAFWCCIQIASGDPFKEILDMLVLVFGATIFLSTSLSFSVIKVLEFSKKKK